MDAVALLGGNEYLVQQLLDRLLDAGFTTAQVKMDITQNRLKALNMFLLIQSSTPTSTANFVNFQECFWLSLTDSKKISGTLELPNSD